MRLVLTEDVQDRLLNWLLTDGSSDDEIGINRTSRTLRLYTLTPNVFGEAGEEVKGLDPGDPVTGYARQAVSFTITNGKAVNSAHVIFPVPLLDWGIVEGLALFDGSGRCLWVGEMEPRFMGPNHTVQVPGNTDDFFGFFLPAGALEINFD